VIAMTGVAIWFAIQNRPFDKRAIFLLVFCLVLTTFSSSDLVPKFIQHEWVRKYSLKALPCFAVWLTLTYQLIKPEKKFLQDDELSK
jgi:hypothetical protein